VGTLAGIGLACMMLKGNVAQPAVGASRTRIPTRLRFQDDTPLFTASVSNASPLLRDFPHAGGAAYPACALQVKKDLNLAVTKKNRRRKEQLVMNLAEFSPALAVSWRSCCYPARHGLLSGRKSWVA